MAFPYYYTDLLSSLIIDEVTHTVTLSDAEVGDKWFIGIARDGADPVGTPSGWVEEISDSTPSSAATIQWFSRTCDGTEAATVDFTGLSSEACASVCMTVQNWAEFEFGTPNPLYTANPDPSSFSPSWGAADTLWIAWSASDSNTGITGYPTGYWEERKYARNNSAGGTVLGVALRRNAVATENAPVFTLGATRNSVAGVIAVRGSAASGTTSALHPLMGM